MPLPHDVSSLGMSAEWFWFESTLDCVIRWERARQLHATTRDPVTAEVASDACFFLDSAATRCWAAQRARA